MHDKDQGWHIPHCCLTKPISARRFAQHNWLIQLTKQSCCSTAPEAKIWKMSAMYSLKPNTKSNKGSTDSHDHPDHWPEGLKPRQTHSTTSFTEYKLFVLPYIHTSRLLPPQTEGTEQEKGDCSAAWFPWHIKIQRICSNRSKLQKHLYYLICVT